jgi:hypothetical protein
MVMRRSSRPLLTTFTIFDEPKRVVKPEDGVADLKLGAYGAFTIGVVADEGATTLEIDPAHDLRLPAWFRQS